MIASLQNFLDTVQFGHVVVAVLLYLLILWILVPLWVYMDAKEKFSNPNIPILLFFVILPFNIPGLIFYVIIRPDDHGMMRSAVSGDDHVIGVPLVKFLKDDGDFVMSFDLKINSNVISESHRSNLNMKVNIDPDEDMVTIVEQVEEQVVQLQDEEEEAKSSNRLAIMPLKDKLQDSLSKNWYDLKAFFKNEEDDDADDDDDDDDDVETERKEEESDSTEDKQE